MGSTTEKRRGCVATGQNRTATGVRTNKKIVLCENYGGERPLRLNSKNRGLASNKTGKNSEGGSSIGEQRGCGKGVRQWIHFRTTIKKGKGGGGSAPEEMGWATRSRDEGGKKSDRETHFSRSKPSTHVWGRGKSKPPRSKCTYRVCLWD